MLRNAQGLNYIKKQLKKKHKELVLNTLIRKGFYYKVEGKNLYVGEISKEEADAIAQEINQIKIFW